MAACSPRFIFEISLSGGGGCEGIHPHSPAGKWIRYHSSLFQTCQLRFVDPHLGKGGLGASSAQFLGAYVWTQMVDRSPGEWKEKLSPLAALTAYRSLVSTGEGLVPSGADLMAQWAGQLSFYQAQAFNLQNMKWPFDQLSFSLFRTNLKVSTHVHLAQIDKTGFGELRERAEKAFHSLRLESEKDFIGAISDLGFHLEKLGYLHPEVQPILENFRQQEIILATKGCGAMGADIILALHRPDDGPALCEWAHKRGLAYEGGLNDLDQGLRIEIVPTIEEWTSEKVNRLSLYPVENESR